MARIFISYGIPKSASTFAWQLIKHVAIAGGLPVASLTTRSKGRDAPEDYIDPVSAENIRLIEADIGNAPVVIKTHGDATPEAAQLVSEGTALVFASYRDPRDIALSLLDHGARSRTKGGADFAIYREPTDTLELIEHQILRFENWVQLCNPLLISYDEICFATQTTVLRIAGRLGVEVDAGAIANEFCSAKDRIGQFNKGERRRFEREMGLTTRKLFLENFSNFYARYFPDEIFAIFGQSVLGSPMISSPPETNVIDDLVVPRNAQKG